MKSLQTLLKVAQRRMDELGVEAAKVQVQVDELHQKQAAIIAREQQEIAAAQHDSMFASMLPAYRMRVKQKIAEVQQQVQAMDNVLAGIREKLQAAYIEKSKFEQLIEQETKRVSAERMATEQAMLDEVAINRAGSSAK
ncbi:MAG TPA: flagellar FliJ family protein [Hyphomonadaceae bacterium]|jgi:flagellar export protein FliJ|nr:flagellar FliJ family protein [Hyphomonadaceae bacterium]HPN07420.1 flagellar FliJ family protein [Hyphomonadaceae bacterium]